MAEGEKFVLPTWFWLVLGCGLAAIVGIRLLPLIQRPKSASPATVSLSHMKQLGTGLMIYCADYDGLLPQAVDWGYASQPYVRSLDVYDDATLGGRVKFGYGLYEPLAAKAPSLYDNPGEIPLLFQSEFAGFNEHGDLTRLALTPRGAGGTDLYAHADSSAKARPRTWAAKPVVMKLLPKKGP